MYAMKIQRKSALLKYFENEPWRIDYEKKAHVACSHNFIIEFACSFQTHTCTMMTMSLCEYGNFQHILLKISGNCLDHEHVKFYACEIITALNYM